MWRWRVQQMLANLTQICSATTQSPEANTGIVLWSDHHRSCPNTFNLLVHLSRYHSILYNTETNRAVKIAKNYIPEIYRRKLPLNQLFKIE
jgi:hypothetical protein